MEVLFEYIFIGCLGIVWICKNRHFVGRGSFSGRGARDVDYGRGLPPRRDDDHPGGVRRPMRMSDGPPPKKMKVGEPMRRSPRGGAGRRY